MSTPLVTDAGLLRATFMRLRCQLYGHKWVKAGIITDQFYRAYWIVECSRCGIDRESIAKGSTHD